MASNSSDNKPIKYVIRVKTGHGLNAGTDSSVFLTIFGNKTKTEQIQLSKANAKREGKLFDKAKLDEFHVMAPNVGQILKINIGHGADGEKRSWLLDYVTIRYADENYKFVARQWLDKDDNNARTSIDLFDVFNQEITGKNEEKEKTDRKSYQNPRSKTSHGEKYVIAEFKRAKTSLEDESSKIVYPKRKEFKPFIFNTLNAYYDTRLIEHLYNMPANELIFGHFNRVTANRNVDPWEDLLIDRTVPSFKMQRQKTQMHLTTNNSKMIQPVQREKSDLQGSTLAPVFPKISMKKPKQMVGPFYVNDIKHLRHKIRENIGNESLAKQSEDKTRTINDYYRMRLDQYHPASKEVMIQAYHAYLENTVGSRHGLEEVLKTDK